MLRKISEGIRAGIEKIRWALSIIAERINVEIAVIRLLGRSEKYETDRQKLLVSIGERVSDLKESGGINILEDDKIRDALKRLDALEEEIAQLRKSAGEISTLEV